MTISESASEMIKITTFYVNDLEYTSTMIQFARTTEPPTPKTETIPSLAYLYAGLLVVMVVGQLFTFE